MAIEGILHMYGFSWFPTGIFQISNLDLASIYIISTGMLKYIILGMIYWFLAYLIISIPYYLVRRKLMAFPWI